MAESASTANAAGSARSSFYHPYRLEVRGVTPISVSLLWSLRPLPLSAIPRNVARHSKSTSYSGAAAPLAALKATAIGHASSSSQPRNSPLHRIQAESSGASGNTSSIVATRSPNRRVTKVAVRNVSPAAKRGGRVPRPIAVGRRESGDWPSDDGATAVDEEEDAAEGLEDDAADKTNDSDLVRATTPLEDDPITPSEASDDFYHANAATRIVETGVSVSVNGVPWSQVVVGDSGAEEAFIVVYGLHPSREYDLLFTVEDKQSSISVSTANPEERTVNDASALGVASTATASTQTALSNALPDRSSPRNSTAGPLSSLPTAGPSQVLPRIKRTQTPPMQDTDQSSADIGADTSSATLAVPVSSSSTVAAASAGATAAALQVSVRKARKDASRAESALRNEIDAIKRGLERMSDVDHRSKQKVLALQESIRQATTQAKDIDEEATAVESEREVWEEREKEKNNELEQIRAEVEESLRVGQSKIKDDNDEIEAMEKELHSIAKAVDEKRAAKEKLERERLMDIEHELTRIHEEIEHTVMQPTAGLPLANTGFYAAAGAAGAQPYSHGSSPLVPTQVPRTRGGRGATRGLGGTAGGSSATGAGSSSSGHNGNPLNSSSISSTSNNSARGGGVAGNASSRRHQTRNLRHHGHHHGQHGGQDQHGQHGHDLGSHQNVTAQHSSSLLNPNNPEFVPSGGVIAAATHSNSPIGMRTMLLPAVDQSPTANARFQVPGYVGSESEPSRRSSVGHLDVDSNVRQSAWRSSGGVTTGASPAATWSQHYSDSLAASSSPQLQHDIWSVPATSSSLARHENVGAGLQSGLGLRTKTSLPFGLNSSLLRDGAYPPFAYGRRGDEVTPASFGPDYGSAVGDNGGVGYDGLLHVSPTGHDAGRGSSAPVSPLQPFHDTANAQDGSA